jgi:ketosteroid isomerase-like protein|tara:strand:+ start:527 stop:940 length:414 start_codon:yes stop_codon:yes gene_type:complete
MSKEKNINLVKKLHHIWNSGEVNLIPEVYAENIIVHWAKGWGLPSKGLQEIEQSILNTRNIFENWHEEVLDLIADEDKVTSRYLSTGVHKQDYMGVPASGKNIEFQEISIYRIDDNKVVEQWCLGDDLHLLSQIKSK